MEIIKLKDQLLLEVIHNIYNIALSEIFFDINLKASLAISWYEENYLFIHKLRVWSYC